MEAERTPALDGRTGSATWRDQERDQVIFDALVALRLERSGETRESAIAWAKEQVEGPSQNSAVEPTPRSTLLIQNNTV